MAALHPPLQSILSKYHWMMAPLPHMMNYILVALGSAVGGVGRYAISSIPVRSTFPFLTLIVNLLGAILIGFVTGLAAKRGLPPQAVLFLKTGVCGGFTTFSTFSLEAYNLFADKAFVSGSVYVAASVIGCLAGIVCGLRLSGTDPRV